MTGTRRRIGILAGGGTLPRKFADAAAARGELAQIVALNESAQGDFSPYPVARASMGQVGRILRTFRAAGVTDVVIIGPVARADIARVRPDLGFFLNLPAILKIISSGGDDSALRGVVRFFQAKGFRVLGPADVAPETLAAEGALTAVLPDEGDARDSRLGFEVIRALGPYDIGQAAVVSGGQVLSIEGAEGTNVMLERLSRRRTGRSNQPAGVLVKRSKPGQELRVDTPSIGPGTVVRAVEAGLRGIAVEAGSVLVADREELVSRADAAEFFILGAADTHSGEMWDRARDARHGPPLLQIGALAPGRLERQDMATAIEVMHTVARYGCGGTVVAARGHVLAVEAGGEGPLAVLDRVETFRKHGRGIIHRRAGLAVLSSFGEVDLTLVGRARAAGLRGLAIASLAEPGNLSPEVIKASNEQGLFLMAPSERMLETP